MSDDFINLDYKSLEMRENFARSMFVAPGEEEHKPMSLKRTQEIFDKGLPSRLEKLLFRVEDALRNGPGA